MIGHYQFSGQNYIKECLLLNAASVYDTRNIMNEQDFGNYYLIGMEKWDREDKLRQNSGMDFLLTN